jgi:hypothetical protein
MGWTLEYFDDPDWVELTGKVQENIEELSGHEEATIILPNTTANRTIVASDQLVRIKFNGTEVFQGTLGAVEYSMRSLKCVLYNSIYEALKRKVISLPGGFNLPASIVMYYIRQAAGLSIDCYAPMTLISVGFTYESCFDAVILVAKILGKDYWTVGGDELHIGTRGSAQSFDGNVATMSPRGIDRFKKRDKVYVHGVDADGDILIGEAGTGTDVASFSCSNPTDLATLNLLAASKLAELNVDDSSVTLTCPITSGVFLHPGDTIPISKPELNLDGTYKIVKLTKKRTTVDIEVDRVRPTTEDILCDLMKGRQALISVGGGGGGSPVIGDESMGKIKPSLISGATVKSSNNLVTTYLKNSCILPGAVAVASPTGNMNSYEAGYIAKALIYKNGSGERDLAKAVLDEFAELQNADGSWYQQYNPYLNSSNLHDRVTTIGGQYSGDLKVDSGAALLAWSMSDYDKIGSTTIYKEVVRKALQFLRDLQYAHTVAHGTGLISNLVYEGTTDTVALAADCAECLLAMVAAMDAYGDSLTTSGGYSVKTMANDVYYSLCTSSWQGDSGRYYATSYPIGEQTEIPFTYKEKISYTAALCAWAVYVFSNSGYRTVGDYSAQAEKALDFINTVTAGQWGGQLYCPYTALADETQEEFSGYTALMTIAMNAVNSAKYSLMIDRSKGLLRWMALADGRVYDVVKPDGTLLVSRISLLEEGYGFLSLPIAQGLLAGA